MINKSCNWTFCDPSIAEVDDADRGNDIDSLDEYHVKSTRTLFVGNLEKETTQQDLIDKFQQYGEIIVSCSSAQEQMIALCCTNYVIR